MRLVLDTNAVVSALLWGGQPRQLIVAAETGVIEVCSSAALLAELQGVLLRPKFTAQLERRGVQAQDLFEGYASLVTLVSAPAIDPTIVRDPDDDQVLAAALAASADLIVSGDADLLEVRRFRGIEIVTPAEAAARVYGRS